MVKKVVNVLSERMSVNTKKECFDVSVLVDRRFMYNPVSGELILGDSFDKKSHSDDYYIIKGTNDGYDNFIRGWINCGKRGDDHSVQFRTYYLNNGIDAEVFNKLYSVLEMFLSNGLHRSALVYNLRENIIALESLFND